MAGHIGGSRGALLASSDTQWALISCVAPRCPAMFCGTKKHAPEREKVSA